MGRKAALATEAWHALGDLTGVLRGEVMAVAGRFDLTPGERRALEALDPDEPRPMRALAESLCCDASNVTWLVDRLEARGYAERQPSPTDRRVKAVALTTAGTDARTRIRHAIHTPPSFLLELSADELEQLNALVAKVLARARGASPAGSEGSAG
jgi:DNA-binding MarR family transcriptional regulator